MSERAGEIRRLKQAIREQAEAARQAKPDKDEASRIIWEKFAALPELAAARTLMCYVHFRAEVRTRPFLAATLKGGKRIVVPYCLDDRLELFWLEHMEELAPGTYGILEPKVELRARAEKRVDVGQLDLVMVPGVAFDRRGARLGHGKGYYDKLLVHVRPDVPLVGLAYECQVVPEIPAQPHDVFMDRVITEKGVYQGTGPSPSHLPDAYHDRPG